MDVSSHRLEKCHRLELWVTIAPKFPTLVVGREEGIANPLFPGIARGEMEVSRKFITVTSSHSMTMMEIMPYISS